MREAVPRQSGCQRESLTHFPVITHVKIPAVRNVVGRVLVLQLDILERFSEQEISESDPCHASIKSEVSVRLPEEILLLVEVHVEAADHKRVGPAIQCQVVTQDEDL